MKKRWNQIATLALAVCYIMSPLRHGYQKARQIIILKVIVLWLKLLNRQLDMSERQVRHTTGTHNHVPFSYASILLLYLYGLLSNSFVSIAKSLDSLFCTLSDFKLHSLCKGYNSKWFHFSAVATSLLSSLIFHFVVINHWCGPDCTWSGWIPFWGVTGAYFALVAVMAACQGSWQDALRPVPWGLGVWGATGPFCPPFVDGLRHGLF